MQLFRKDKQDELADILSVFETVKMKLTNFLDDKSKAKAKLEDELAGVEAEIEKSKSVLEKIRELTSGEDNE